MYHLGWYEEAIAPGVECSEIFRNLMVNEATNIDMHKNNFCLSSFRLAKCLLAAGNADAALPVVDESIDILMEKENLADISDDMTNFLFLRADILFHLVSRRSPDVHDALLESLLLEITPSRLQDTESAQ